MKYFEVVNLDHYQHYKDRRPPWVKLYRSTLESYDFGHLPDASKWLALGTILLASECDNRIPWDVDWIGGRLQMTTRPDLQTLVASGFIRVVSDDSRPLASCKQNLPPEIETETETETETEQTSPDLFDTAWTAYPRRPNNSRVAARKAWDARIKEGANPADILDGVQRYAAYVVASGTEPKFVKMASTFFGPGRHWESDYTVSEKVDAELEAIVAESRPEAYVNAAAVRAWVERTKADMASGGLSPFGTRSGLETPFPATGGASS